MRGGIVIAAMGMLAMSACDLAAPARDAILPPSDRNALAFRNAEIAVTPIMARKAPGTSPDRAVACILDYASKGQVEALSFNQATGQPALNDDIVMDILYKPGVRQCLRGGPVYWLMF